MKRTYTRSVFQAMAIATTFGLSAAGPHRASAAPMLPISQSDSSPAVTILSPVPRSVFGGIKPVEIAAFYQGSSSNQITNLELFVDGVKAAQKVLDNPEERGVVSFLVDASALTSGLHHIVVRATANDAEIASAKTSFTFDNNDTPVLGGSDIAKQGPPTIQIKDPSVDGQIQGRVTIQIEATDPSGKSPFVSLFIDRTFHTLKNYSPYEFTWDTSSYPNGYHTIDAFAYNEAQEVTHASSMRVLVNNPGGRTEIRSDLKDNPAKPLRSGKLDHKFFSRMNNRVLAPKFQKTINADSSIEWSNANLPKEAPPPKVSLKKSRVLKIARKPASPAFRKRLNIENVSFISGELARLAELIPSSEYGLINSTEYGDPFSKSKRWITPKPRTKPVDTSASNVASPLYTNQLPVTHVSNVTPTETLWRNALATKRTELIVAEDIQPTIRNAPAINAIITASFRNVGTTRVAATSQMIQVAPSTTIKTVMPHATHRDYHLNWLRAGGQSTIMFNSSRMELERPLTSDGSVLFGPLRRIFESGGGSLVWEARTGVVTAHNTTTNSKLTIGQSSATVNNARVTLDGKPYLNNGRTMIPLSFLQSMMNVTVQFDRSSGHILITSKDIQ